MFRMKVSWSPDRSRQEAIKERIRRSVLDNAKKEALKNKENKNANS